MAQSKPTSASSAASSQYGARHLNPDNLSTMKKGLSRQLELMRESTEVKPLSSPASGARGQLKRVLRRLGA